MDVGVCLEARGNYNSHGWTMSVLYNYITTHICYIKIYYIIRYYLDQKGDFWDAILIIVLRNAALVDKFK